MIGGQLRHKITFQVNTPVSDGMGGQTASWADSFDAFAAVWPISANERIKNQGIEHEITHRVRMRYESRIVPTLRIKFGTRYLEIISIINPNERNVYLDIMATETKDS